MHNRQLIEQFQRWRSSRQRLVLVTVADTAGSTYSKAGRHLLIRDGSEYAGLVGGGCLEGDLLAQAETVFETGQPRLVTYDMREAADDLWGVGLGCRGMMQLLLQPLDAETNWQPFTDIATAMQSIRPVDIELVLAAGSSQRRVGEHRTLAAAAPRAAALTTCDDGSTVLRWTVQPWTRLLILGGGPDAAPVVRGARELGWQVCVCDHREALLASPALQAADERVWVEPAKLADSIDLHAFDAAVVMSHHLPSDQAYLQELAHGEHRYVGVLGPAARRDELLRHLNLHANAFAGRLRGPVGLRIGADSPAGIALALLAEIHQTLKASHATGGSNDD